MSPHPTLRQKSDACSQFDVKPSTPITIQDLQELQLKSLEALTKMIDALNANGRKYKTDLVSVPPTCKKGGVFLAESGLVKTMQRDPVNTVDAVSVDLGVASLDALRDWQEVGEDKCKAHDLFHECSVKAAIAAVYHAAEMSNVLVNKQGGGVCKKRRM